MVYSRLKASWNRWQQPFLKSRKLARQTWIQWKTAESRFRKQKLKTNLHTEEKCRINGAWEQDCSTYSVGYKASEATSRAACFVLL